jgi:hypothetical protein
MKPAVDALRRALGTNVTLELGAGETFGQIQLCPAWLTADSGPAAELGLRTWWGWVLHGPCAGRDVIWMALSDPDDDRRGYRIARGWARELGPNLLAAIASSDPENRDPRRWQLKHPAAGVFLSDGIAALLRRKRRNGQRFETIPPALRNHAKPEADP